MDDVLRFRFLVGLFVVEKSENLDYVAFELLELVGDRACMSG